MHKGRTKTHKIQIRQSDKCSRISMWGSDAQAVDHVAKVNGETYQLENLVISLWFAWLLERIFWRWRFFNLHSNIGALCKMPRFTNTLSTSDSRCLLRDKTISRPRKCLWQCESDCEFLLLTSTSEKELGERTSACWVVIEEAKTRSCRERLWASRRTLSIKSMMSSLVCLANALSLQWKVLTSFASWEGQIIAINVIVFPGRDMLIWQKAHACCSKEQTPCSSFAIRNAFKWIFISAQHNECVCCMTDHKKG